MTIIVQSADMLCIQPIRKSEDRASWYELSFGSLTYDGNGSVSSFADHSAVPLNLQIPQDWMEEEDDVTLLTTTIATNATGRDAFDDSMSLNSSVTIRSTVSKSSKQRRPRRRPSLGRLGKKKESKRLLDPEGRHASDINKGSRESLPMQASVSRTPQVSPSETSPTSSQRFSMFKKHFGGKYLGFKERARRANESNERRGVVKSALYTCIEDDNEDLLGSLLRSSSTSSAPNHRRSSTKRSLPLPNVAVSRSA